MSGEHLFRKGDIVLIRATIRYDTPANESLVGITYGDGSYAFISREGIASIESRNWKPGDRVRSTKSGNVYTVHAVKEKNRKKMLWLEDEDGHMLTLHEDDLDYAEEETEAPAADALEEKLDD